MYLAIQTFKAMSGQPDAQDPQQTILYTSKILFIYMSLHSSYIATLLK